MKDGSDPRIVIGVCTLLLIAFAALYIESLGLPPGVYDPLGSATVPQATVVVAAILVIWIIGMAVSSLKANAALSHTPDDVDTSGSLWRGLVVLLLTPIYITAMQAGLIGFGIATTVFLFASIMALRWPDFRTLPLAASVALVVGFGSQWLFTQIFIIDLPT